MKKAFNNDKYLKMQREEIMKRIEKFDNKLYLEFGGKLFDDYHASRVLPGFLPDSKLRMLLGLKDKVEVIIVINSADIQNNKVRSDLGISYESEVLRLIDACREAELYVGSVVLAQYKDQSLANVFKQKLENLNIKTYLHYPINGYPQNIPLIVSEEGLGKNEFVETTRPLVVVTAPGPGSGKMATCLSQLYHERKRGVKAGYAKFETFPVWNLPLHHPVNLAYEAATSDLNDSNVIDPYHLEKYDMKTVNYNRDVEVFPLLKTIFEKIYGESPYSSPTDMGVNMVGFCIENDEEACKASRNEIIRRYFDARIDEINGKISEESVGKNALLMNKVGVTVNNRKCVKAALEKEKKEGVPCLAMELKNSKIITGKTSSLLGAPAALLLNALKYLGRIDDQIKILSKNVIEPIQLLKVHSLGNHNPRLHAEEILIALAIAAPTNPVAEIALKNLHKLKGVEVHSSYILPEADLSTLKKLGINVTMEPVINAKKLYRK